MLLSRNRLKEYALKKREVITDDEGGKYASYTKPIIIKAIIWPADGRLQAEMYGERLNYIQNMLYQKGGPELKEGDGICYKVSKDEELDYKVISIKEYTEHYFVEIERINHDRSN